MYRSHLLTWYCPTCYLLLILCHHIHLLQEHLAGTHNTLILTKILREYSPMHQSQYRHISFTNAPYRILNKIVADSTLATALQIPLSISLLSWLIDHGQSVDYKRTCPLHQPSCLKLDLDKVFNRLQGISWGGSTKQLPSFPIDPPHHELLYTVSFLFLLSLVGPTQPKDSIKGVVVMDGSMFII